MSALQMPHFSGDQVLETLKKIDEVARIDYIKQHNLHLLKVNDANETLLHVAARCGDFSITKILIDAGSNVNAQDKSKKTPIILAIENQTHEYLQVIKILCKSYANIYITDENGKSAAKILVDNTNISNHRVLNCFLNAIHCDCKKNSKMTARKLISQGYALCDAVAIENSEVIEQMILQGCSVNSYSKDERWSALSRAIGFMDLETFRVLLKHGVDINTIDKFRAMPIFYYGRYTTGNIQQPEIIRILLRESVLLKNLEDKRMVLQLKTGFEKGNKEVVQILLEYRNDILNIRDNQGQTPLHYLSNNPHHDIFELLKGRTFNVNAKDEFGSTPIYVASRNQNVHINTFKFLMENGADVNIAVEIPSAIPYFLDTPLFCLCQNESATKETFMQILDLFFKYDSDIQYIGLHQGTVFDIILRNQTFYMAEPLIAHLAILDDLKKPITQYIRNKIDSHDSFKKYFDVCKVELAKMKYNIINNNLTLYMMVVNEKNEHQTMKCCRFSPNALSKFEEVKKKFSPDHVYYRTIQKRISSVLPILKLWREAAPILCKILKFVSDPYHISIVEIMDYLDDKDMQNVLKAEILR